MLSCRLVVFGTTIRLEIYFSLLCSHDKLKLDQFTAPVKWYQFFYLNADRYGFLYHR